MTERERPCGPAWLGTVHGGELGRGWLGEPLRTPRPLETLRDPPDPPAPRPHPPPGSASPQAPVAVQGWQAALP